MIFTTSKIKEGDETVADKLRQAREQKSLSLEDVSKKLDIKYEYLENLEKGEYDRLPSGIYEKTFLKKYAKLLGLDFKELTQNFLKEKEVGKGAGEKDIFAKKEIKNREFLVFPKIIKNILIVIVASVFIVYLGFYLKTSFSPPEIKIIEPIDNLITENNFVYVIGKTNPKTEVTINNQQILKNETGFFKERINLKKGVNTIIISGKNKYSQKKVIEKQILVK